MTAATLLDLLPGFDTGQRIRWTPAAQDAGFSDRTFTITDVVDLDDRWRVEARGPKRGHAITVTWAKCERPRIEAAA